MAVSEGNSSTVFKDEVKLFANYSTGPLLYRVGAFRSLVNAFRGAVHHPGTCSTVIYLTGGAGSGRTTVAGEFGRLLGDLIMGRRKFKYIHISCTEESGLVKILKKILHRINSDSDIPGQSIESITNCIQREIHAKNMHVTVCLDDADALFSKDAPVLMSLLKKRGGFLNEMNQFFFIFIVKSDKVKKNLSPAASKICYGSDIHLQKYEYSAIKGILQGRVSDVFKEGVVSERSIRLIAMLCRTSGNVRDAITILWQAGRLAGAENSSEVSESHIRQVYKNLEPLLDFGKSLEFTLTQKMILFAMFLVNKHELHAFLSESEIWEAYQRICLEFDLKPTTKERSLLELWYLAEVIEIINTKRVLKTRAGSRMEETLYRVLLPNTVLKRLLVYHLEGEKSWSGMRSYFVT